MEGNIVKFNARERSVNEVLDEVKSQEYESLIIVGYKNDQVSVHPTHIESMTKIVGAIEISKLHIINTWSDCDGTD